MACLSPSKGKSTRARKGKRQAQEKIKMQGQSHAATLRLQGKSAVSGDDFNHDWHAATLRLPGKSAPCKSSPTPPKAVSSGLLLDKNKCETDFFE